MAHPMGESKQGGLRVDFDRRLKPEFHGSKVTTDAGSLAYRELDDSILKRLNNVALRSRPPRSINDQRTRQNTTIESVCDDGSRFTGYCRLSWVVVAKCTASAP